MGGNKDNNGANLFFGRNGDSQRPQLASCTYNLFKTRQWFSYEDVLKNYLCKDNLKFQVSKYDEYNVLKKAFSAVRKEIEKRYPGSIEEGGNNRCKKFRYAGDDADPLSDLVNVKVINDIRQYFAFCQDSSGFFPIAWLEYFFKDCKDLLQITERKNVGGELLTSSIDRELTNINLLPRLYECIKNKTVVEFEYKPYSEEKMRLTFHPQHLHEYNGRWFLLGHAEGKEPEWSFNVALDRIVGKLYEKERIPYMFAPQGYYEKYFASIVGVTHMIGQSAERVRIRAHGLGIFKLVETKRLHRSQQVVTPFARYDDGEYGEFEVDVEMNNEFIGSVLQLGAGLEVMSPPSVREVFARRVLEMQERYKGKRPEPEGQLA